MNGSDIGEIIHAALPLMASAYAFKKGQLGSFAQPYVAGLERQAQDARLQKNDAADESYRQKTLAAQQQVHTDANARMVADDARQATQDQAVRDQRMNALIANALSNAAKDPAFQQLVNQPDGPDSYHLTVPGLGNITLRDALTRVPTVQGTDGKYHFDAPPTPVKEPELVPTAGPDGKPVYGPKKAGAAVYERPRAPGAPKEPKIATISVKRDPIDPGASTVTKSDPATGFSSNYTIDQIKGFLKAHGYPSDDDAADAVMNSPAGLKELLP